VLRIAWSTDKKFESNRVFIKVKIAFTFKKVDSIEPIIAPAFTDFKLR
jgi:hypothetical protein